jgi:hypothetical protein
MKKYLVAVAIAALTQPAFATTFPTLTTIYVGGGVRDTGLSNLWVTVFQCTNVSGQTASLRVLVLEGDGAVAGSLTRQLAHGALAVISTNSSTAFGEDSMETEALAGTVNIESTQSGVFCSATVVEQSVAKPTFVMDIHLVRVNPHPGTVQ